MEIYLSCSSSSLFIQAFTKSNIYCYQSDILFYFQMGPYVAFVILWPVLFIMLEVLRPAITKLRETKDAKPTKPGKVQLGRYPSKYDNQLNSRERNSDSREQRKLDRALGKAQSKVYENQLNSRERNNGNGKGREIAVKSPNGHSVNYSQLNNKDNAINKREKKVDRALSKGQGTV